MIEASCHCGAVRLYVPHVPEEAKACNCSICRRLGAIWAYYLPAEVTTPAADLTDPYMWGDRMIAFHRCRTCGCATHWLSLDPTTRRMGVNARMFDPQVMAGIRVRPFDGAETWRFLDEG